jgi:hypothetical protein
MTQGLRVPVAFPHDGHAADKGSGLPLAGQYKSAGANMMSKFATNHGTDHFNIEPALEEMRELMWMGKIIIAQHNTELLEELRHYHRNEDFKIVKQRDDLVSALRYAVMMRRNGKARSDCDGVGFGSMPYAGQRRTGSGPQYARGTSRRPSRRVRAGGVLAANHPREFALCSLEKRLLGWAEDSPRAGCDQTI